MANLRAVEIKAFVPSRDYERSKQFYKDVGFEMASDTGGIAYFHHGEVSFLLEDSFPEGAALRPALHLLVEDVDAWWKQLQDANIAGRYDVKISDIVQQPWRMRDFTLEDPSGVKWRIAQNTD